MENRINKIKEDIKEYINKKLIPMISNVESPFKWELLSMTPTYLILVNYSNEKDFDDEEFVRKLAIIFNRDGSWIIKSDANKNDVKREWNVNYKYFSQSTQYFCALYQLMRYDNENKLLKHLSKMYQKWNNTPDPNFRSELFNKFRKN